MPAVDEAAAFASEVVSRIRRWTSRRKRRAGARIIERGLPGGGPARARWIGSSRRPGGAPFDGVYVALMKALVCIRWRVNTPRG